MSKYTSEELGDMAHKILDLKTANSPHYFAFLSKMSIHTGLTFKQIEDKINRLVAWI